MLGRAVSRSSRAVQGTRNFSTRTTRKFNTIGRNKPENLRAGLGAPILALTVVGGLYYVYKRGQEKRSRVFIEPENRKKLVILGSGWAAVNLLSNINTDAYEVTMVSPNNYFLFTPLLPSAVVGTLQPSSIIQPARRFYKDVRESRVKFYESACVAINSEEKSVDCEDNSPIVGENSKFSLDYDYLVVAVGSQPNTFNTEGVYENAYFVKTIEDARRLRNHILDCIETANLPGTSDEERKRLLHFVIVGGGPTGVETAAEINDFMEEDIARYYPNLKDDIQVSLIQSGDHLLNTYSEAISIKTKEAFARQNINVIFNSRVTKVDQKDITVMDKATKQKNLLPYGTCVWSTGVSLNPLAKDLINSLPEQNNRRAITTDKFLRVKGSPDIFALGDCGTIEQEKMLAKVTELFVEADTDGDGSLSLEEVKNFAQRVADVYPQMRLHAENIPTLFVKHDTNSDEVLSLDEFKELLKEIDRGLTTLPATAQVATQQGKYLATVFNKHLHTTTVLDNAEGFNYNHMGSFAYIGKNDAVMDLKQGAFSGFITWFMWRSAYITKQYSLSNMASMAFDWSKVIFFGRDISRQ